MSDVINDFIGSNFFLSNFSKAVVTYEEIVYPTTEHAYQAAKTVDEGQRRQIALLATAALAKKAGRKVTLRADWEMVKLGVMEDLLRRKFSDPVLAEKLKETASQQLVEGNRWGDTYWGVCKGVGENHLGTILMKIRDELVSGKALLKDELAPAGTASAVEVETASVAPEASSAKTTTAWDRAVRAARAYADKVAEEEKQSKQQQIEGSPPEASLVVPLLASIAVSAALAPIVVAPAVLSAPVAQAEGSATDLALAGSFVKNSIEQVESHGGYKIIYADPNWEYDQGGRGAAKNHYKTSMVDRLAAMPVNRIASKDAVLFMWGTWPHIEEMFRVIHGWGFEFKTCAFVWVKYHEKSEKRCVGGGFWTRANTEFCLLCVRGKNYPRRLEETASRGVRQLIETWPTVELDTQLPDQVLLAPRGEHSAKPPEARERIFQLLGSDLPAIELFARCVDECGNTVVGGRIAEGWDQWGDQCDSDIDMTLDIGTNAELDIDPSGGQGGVAQSLLIDESVGFADGNRVEEFAEEAAGAEEVAVAAGSDNEFGNEGKISEAFGNAVKEVGEVAVAEARETASAEAAAVESVNDFNNEDEDEGETNMAFLPKGWGKEVAKAEATIPRQRLADGEYVLMHKACFSKATKKGEAIIIEHEIMEAKKISADVEPTPVGTTWGYFLPKYGEAAVMLLPNMKGYVQGLLGIDPKKVTDDALGDTIDLIGGEAQLARGMLIKGITFHTTTKADEDFTGVNWYPMPGENNPNADSVKQRRARLDAAVGGALPGTNGSAQNGSGNGHAQAAPPPPPGAGAPPPPDLLAGWTQNPQAPDYFYKYVDGQPVQKLKVDILAGR